MTFRGRRFLASRRFRKKKRRRRGWTTPPRFHDAGGLDDTAELGATAELRDTAGLGDAAGLRDAGANWTTPPGWTTPAGVRRRRQKLDNAGRGWSAPAGLDGTGGLDKAGRVPGISRCVLSVRKFKEWVCFHGDVHKNKNTWIG